MNDPDRKRADERPKNTMTSAISDEAIMARFFVRPGFMLARVEQISAALYGALSPVATVPQSEFLLLVDRHGAMPQIRLSQAAGYDKSTTGHVLDNLQARGWVDRSP